MKSSGTPATQRVGHGRKKNAKKNPFFQLTSQITRDLIVLRQRNWSHWKEENFFYKKSVFPSQQGPRLCIGFLIFFFYRIGFQWSGSR